MVPVRRSARDWLTYFAGGGLVLILCALSPTGQSAQRGVQTRESDGQPNANQKAPPPPLTSNHPDNSVAANVIPQPPAQKLIEESGAKWTDTAVALASIGSFITTVVLAWSTVQLWWETKRLAKGGDQQGKDMKASIAEATLSAKAAADSAAASLRIAEATEDSARLERAWVIVDDYMVAPTNAANLRGVNLGPGLLLNIAWINGGRTPAMHADIFIGVQFVQPNAQIPTFQSVLNSQANSVIGQNRRGVSNFDFVPQPQVLALKARTIKVFVHSAVEYRDIFQPNVIRRSEVTGELQYTGQMKTDNGVARDAYGLQFVGPQNGCT